MQLPKNYTKVTGQKNEIVLEVLKAIGSVCRKHDHQIEYAIINQALIEVLGDNLKVEIRMIMEGEDEKT